MNFLKFDQKFIFQNVELQCMFPRGDGVLFNRFHFDINGYDAFIDPVFFRVWNAQAQDNTPVYSPELGYEKSTNIEFYVTTEDDCPVRIVDIILAPIKINEFTRPYTFESPCTSRGITGYYNLDIFPEILTIKNDEILPLRIGFRIRKINN